MKYPVIRDAIIEAPGDSSAGIPSDHIIIKGDFCDPMCVEKPKEEIERVRKILKEAFSEILDVGKVTVFFPQVEKQE